MQTVLYEERERVRGIREKGGREGLLKEHKSGLGKMKEIKNKREGLGKEV